MIYADITLILEHSQSVSTLLAESLNLQMRVYRERRVRGFGIPTEFLADHIEECATANVLTLHPRRQDIRGHQAPAGGDVTGVADQIIVAQRLLYKPLRFQRTAE